MGRVSLIIIWFTLSALTLSAQSGGYPTLEFVENKGQWDSLVKFRADLSAGNIFIKKKGFLVIQHDTGDLRRIHELLHNGVTTAGGAGSGVGAARLGRTPSASPSVAVTSSKDLPVPAHPGGGSGAGTGQPGDPFLLHSHSYEVSFEGASDSVVVLPEKPLPSYNNYFIGDKKKWAIHNREFQGIVYQNLYDGIDLHYYTEQGFVKYDLVVRPGGDPNKIILKYTGQDKLTIRKNQIYIQTSVGTVRELEPHSYQVSEKGRTEVACTYKMLDGNRIQFKIKDYNPGQTLVIDPTEVFCSFTGSRSDNWGYTATYDNSGEFFLGGIVLQYPGDGGSGSLYGATPGAFQSTFQGGDGSEGAAFVNGELQYYYDYDIGLMKFNSNGTTRLWATYMGGAGDEQPHSLVCDPQGNLIITGRTSSADFPTVKLPQFGPGGGLDLFVAKLSANGSTLMGSMKIGGTGNDGVNNSPKYVNQYGGGTQELRLNYGDDGRSEVILDASNNIYVAACTRPVDDKPFDFPTTAGAFQMAPGKGTQDGVLLKLSADVSTVLFSSYIGGSGVDAAFVLALNPTDNTIFVAGGTSSTDLPGTSNGTVLKPTSQGDINGFVSIVSNDGHNLLKTTYFGADGSTDMIYGIGFDKKGYPYITGTTNSVIPVVNSPFNQNNVQASGKQFITKLQPDLSGIVYSANFGPAGGKFPNISPTAFLVDRCENVYVSGWGGGIDIDDGYDNAGTTGLTVSSSNIKPTTDGADFYFFVLQKNATSQLYGSFFGQTEATAQTPQGRRSSLGDHVDGGTSRFDAQGVIYQAICANCGGIANFPTTPGVAFGANGAVTIGGCNEAAVKISFNFAGVSAGLKSITHGRGDSVGCVPLTVSFQDTIRNAKSYIWDFGDGQRDTTTNYSLDHTFTKTGTFSVTLVAIDSNSCNVADTVYRTIIVSDNPSFLAFDIARAGPCTVNQYSFDNESTHSGGSPAFTDTSFNWNFGDGTGLVPTGLGTTIHSYAAPGPYTVSLILVDTNYCNYPDTLSKPFYVAQNVKASFSTPARGCAPYLATFKNTSIAGLTYYWNFGDGSPIDSTDSSPTHLYSNVGSYIVTLTAVDSTTCNITDTYTYTITVVGKPGADFTYSPQSPQPPNTPTVFTDNSNPGGIRYEWLFGDSSSEVKTTGDTVIHQYNRTDTYQACLVVTNETGCSDTACHPVSAVINPLLDVPNAFTPGRFGQNGIVKVMGFGISRMTWRIYNRWGQMVFESIDPNIGWDGTWKGTVQPMDVYGYTLEAEFSDGTHVAKKGDITLIR